MTWLPRLPRRHQSRRRSQQGAVAVEAAIITPLFILLVFGIIEFGMVFKDFLAVTSSVRAGARMASAEPRNLNFAQDAADQVAREGGALNMSKIKSCGSTRPTQTYPSRTEHLSGGGGTSATARRASSSSGMPRPRSSTSNPARLVGAPPHRMPAPATRHTTGSASTWCSTTRPSPA